MKSFLPSMLLLLLILPIIHPELIIIGPPELSSSFNNRPIKIVFGKLPSSNDFYIHGQLYVEAFTESHQACQELEHLPSFNDGETYLETSQILLADMGGCSLSQKAKNAQNAGAAFLLLRYPEDGDISKVVLEDDEVMRGIHIPIGLISFQDGTKLQNFVEAKPLEKVMLEVNFRQMKIKEEVDFKFIFSSSELRAYELFEKWESYKDQFKEIVKFTPIYVSHVSPYFIEKEPKRELNCVSKGRYCYYPKETTIIQDGQRIIMESIRQKCLFNYDKEKYFEYLKTFHQNCLLRDTPKFNDRCSKTSLEKIGFDIDFSDKCIAQSFGVDNLLSSNYFDYDNKILKQDYNEIMDLGVRTFPAAVIDGTPLTGMLNENSILDAICNKLIDKPEACNSVNPINQNQQNTVRGRKRLVYFLVFVLFVVNIGIFFVCRKYIMQRVSEKIDFNQMDIDGRINNVINNYLTLQKNQEMDYKAFDTDTSSRKEKNNTPIEGSVAAV